MKKIITIIVCSISFLVLSACVSKKKLSEDVKTIKKREEISKLIEEIQKQSKSTIFESLNDKPTNDKGYIIIKFTHQNEENDSVVYLYTRKENSILNILMLGFGK